MDWAAALADSTALRAQALLVAEGRLVIERILAGAAGGPDAVVSVLATAAAAHALGLESRLGARVTVRTPAEMQALTGFNFHRGVIALVRRPAPADVAHVIEASIARLPTPDSRLPILVVAEHLVDVDNVGSCFRNARAFGAACVLLDERCPDPLYRKAVRTSLGHVLEVPWAQAPVEDILTALHQRGVTTVGLTPGREGCLAPPVNLRDLAAHLDPARPAAVVVGNEGSGLSAATLAACSHLACIPMAEGADSLNVATALAVALYELTRARSPEP